MEAYRLEREIPADGAVVLSGLPFPPGNKIEIVMTAIAPESAVDYHPFRGRKLTYIDPFEPAV